MNFKRLEKLTGVSQKERLRALRWLNGLSEANRATVCREAWGAFLPMLKRGQEEELCEYAALILSIRANGYDALRRNTPDRMKVLSAVRMSRVANLKRARASPVRDRILRYWGEVVELKRNGIGNRLIARYLTEQRRAGKISPSYIARLWKIYGETGGDLSGIQGENV